MAALELERQGVDVVVTDMRMPGMDGVACSSGSSNGIRGSSGSCCRGMRNRVADARRGGGASVFEQAV